MHTNFAGFFPCGIQLSLYLVHSRELRIEPSSHSRELVGNHRQDVFSGYARSCWPLFACRAALTRPAAFTRWTPQGDILWNPIGQSSSVYPVSSAADADVL